MNKSEAKLVAFLLRWGLGQEQGIDAGHAFRDLAERVRAALGEGPDRYEINALYADRRPQVTVREPPRPPETQWERAQARAAFHEWMPYLGSTFYGPSLGGRQARVFRRVRDAVDAVRWYRQLSNTRGDDHEQEAVAVRVAAETLAHEINARAGDRQDPDTIAWVVAGLLCRRQPFCVGCDVCQTVTSPHRAMAG